MKKYIENIASIILMNISLIFKYILILVLPFDTVLREFIIHNMMLIEIKQKLIDKGFGDIIKIKKLEYLRITIVSDLCVHYNFSHIIRRKLLIRRLNKY
jgi:hypothetical protein